MFIQNGERDHHQGKKERKWIDYRVSYHYNAQGK